MRPYNDDRIIVEYAAVLRVSPTLGLFDTEPFPEDVLALLQSGVNRPVLWRGHEWYLGNVEADRALDGSITAISARFGWGEETPSQDVPPSYDVTTHEWADDVGRARQGAVAFFVIDASEHLLAVTSLAGDLQVAGMCRALANLLNREELEARRQIGARADREWMVKHQTERGSFDNWVSRVERVTKISATFHLPNPRTREDIDPAVDYLIAEGAVSGSLRVENPAGLANPTGHPLVNAAVAMQENDYGTLTARGETADGQVDNFNSEDHPVRDRVEADPEDEHLSIRGVVVRLKSALADRIGRGM